MSENRGSSAEPAVKRRSRGWLGRVALLAVIFALPAAGAVLNFVGIYFDGSAAVPDGLDGATGVALSGDGRHAYAVGYEDDALVVFARDATAESLTFVEVLFDQVAGVFGLDGASAVTVSPDGRHVYATGEVDDALAVFSRDASFDTLAFVETQDNGVGGVFGLDGASAVTVSPDGRHVYATGSLSNAVAVFARDVSLDTLSFAGAAVDGVGGVEGLEGAQAVAADPLRLRLYVAGAVADSLVVFARDATTDGLTYLDTLTDGVDGIDGIDGAAAVLVSADGVNLYVAGRDEDALAVFSLPFGIPSPAQTVRNEQGGVIGLDAPTALAESSDGRYLFVACESGSLVAFRRNLPSGVLTFLAAATDPDAPTLLGASALAVSPDGQHLLVASRDTDAVVMFRIDALFGDGFESGNTAEWSSSTP